MLLTRGKQIYIFLVYVFICSRSFSCFSSAVIFLDSGRESIHCGEVDAAYLLNNVFSFAGKLQICFAFCEFKTELVSAVHVNILQYAGVIC